MKTSGLLDAPHDYTQRPRLKREQRDELAKELSQCEKVAKSRAGPSGG
jgi:hypothetical protein